MSTTVYSQVLIYTAESTGTTMERTKMPNLRNGSIGGFEPGLILLRVRHSTTELPRSTEEWNIFKRRLDVFVSGSGLDPDASSSQLFQCAGDELGDSLLKTDPSIVSKPTSVAMAAMKSLAVIVVATGVMRTELVRMQ